MSVGVPVSGSTDPLPPVDAPLPDLNKENEPFYQRWWQRLKDALNEALNRSAQDFDEERDTQRYAGSGSVIGARRWTVRGCCNWNNLRTRLLLMCALDLFGSLYGLASANRVRLISPLLNLTGLLFSTMLLIGMGITLLGIVGILRHNSEYLRVFFYWSIFSLVLNFLLSCIDLTTIDKQCQFIWDHFDHSAYRESDHGLFLRQCESYAFVFFSVVMVALAFARLYYIYLIRAMYVSITPDHDAYDSGRGGRSRGYAYRQVGHATASAPYCTPHDDDGSDEEQ